MQTTRDCLIYRKLRLKNRVPHTYGPSLRFMEIGKLSDDSSLYNNYIIYIKGEKKQPLFRTMGFFWHLASINPRLHEINEWIIHN